MPYFDLTTNGNMLPQAVRDQDGVEIMVAEAEYDIIDHYTKVRGDLSNTPLHQNTRTVTGSTSLYTDTEKAQVYLQWYKVDPDELTTEDELAFKLAMQKAIVALVKLRTEQKSREPGVKAVWQGRRKVEYFANSKDVEFGVIPKSVTRYLRKYDQRPPI